ncbi:MAG: hypothetical protein KDA47_03235 [Planctomycetales bacterium]|nr:hypothetical protein [Planctomycetales bacterium]
MDQQDSDEDNDVELPDDIADAWAAVLIDVYEKAKHEAESDAEKDLPQRDANQPAPSTESTSEMVSD